MSQAREQIEEARRKVALATAPLTVEMDAAEAAGLLEVQAEQPPKSPRPRQGYWRSLGELIKSPSFRQWVHDEFPHLGKESDDRAEGPSRRRFLQLMGASIALAGAVTGCRKETNILPYKEKPVNTVIGKGMYYASSFVVDGKAIGVLAETHEGRPTKIEGNPQHPNSHGGTDLFAQASVLDLYDPDRSRRYREGKAEVSREQFAATLDGLAGELKAAHGDGLAVLLQHAESPAVEMILEQMKRTMPQAKVFVYSPLRAINSRNRAKYDLSAAKVIVSLDADILGLEDEGTRYRKQFADGRRDPAKGMNRLYVIEPAISQTGAAADHRLGMKASEIGLFGEAILRVMVGDDSGFTGRTAKWVEAVAEDLKQAGRDAVVVAGERHGHSLQYVAYQINQRLGAIGRTVQYHDDDRFGTITLLAEAIRGGRVKTLAVAHGNPAYDAPADLQFTELIARVPRTLHLGLYDDETADLCAMHAPAAHYLEGWGDVRATDGTVSVVQPMIEPLLGGMTEIELLARLIGFGTTDPYELVKMSFHAIAGPGEEAWTKYLQEGVFAGKPALANEPVFGKTASYSRVDNANAIEICFAADPSVYDGRFANNAWLQECPDPITKLTWDNAAIIGPPLAKKLGVQTGDVVKIEVDGRSLEIAAYLLPGVVDDSITLPLGYGRAKGGSLCKGAGFNAYTLRTSSTMAFAADAKVTKTGKTYPLATTQEHWAMDLDRHFETTADAQAKERAIIREGSLEDYRKDPKFAQKMGEHAPIKLNIYTAPTLTGANQWALMVDLNACVGCNACVVACQAENNVPVVGKDEVIRGREMHWIRLDRYFSGESNDEVRPTLQPMMCQHCENAPCEPVCPVNATVHSPEGLNEMVYNRCIGTRYCSNNCPYKVRRFNFYDWNKGTIRADTAPTRDGQIQPVPTQGFSAPQVFQPPMQEMLKMAENPNVTVRIRGVMEKCTFCVQRIEAAKIAERSRIGQGPANAQVEGQAAVKVPSGAGAVVSACAQVCPTQAIVFGDKSDGEGEFAQRWEEAANPRAYQVLEHLNVRPRTHYLAKVRNVNPNLEPA